MRHASRIRLAAIPATLALSALWLGPIAAVWGMAEDGLEFHEAPLTPERAREAIRVGPALRVELVAAEPLVVSPVACAFDAKGRLFVVEDRGYPTGPGPGEPPSGRIARLEDLDGDGRMDRRAEFADGLSFPNGVMPWRDGVIVTCAPDLLWLRDTNDDGKADVREVLFTGFSTEGSTQLRASHPTLSIDNWIYVAGGLTGGSVTNPSMPDHPAVEFGRADFRFRPDGRTFEKADGGAQFGLTFDDFGRRFFCYNRVHVQHAVLSSAALARNPHLGFSATVQDCPAEMEPEPLAGHGRSARIYPISANVTTADSHAGTFTAACGVFVDRGTGLPESYRGAVFACDPTANLVHFDLLEPAGATFSARPAVEGVEFLASTDDWFRPVFLGGGPDGALYVCDMDRKTIEHPDYLPEEVRKRTDFEGGKATGRIWRVVRDDAQSEDLAPLRRVELAEAETAELCEAIRSHDGWWRDTAHRLLLERADPSAIGPLSEIVADPEAYPASVVHALRLLEAMDGLSDVQVRDGLRHEAAGVREHALQLAEVRLQDNASWAVEILGLADDPDPRVRFQAAISLGFVAPPADLEAIDPVPGALARIAARAGGDRWTRAAVLSSLSGREGRFLQILRTRGRLRGDATIAPELCAELGRMLPLASPREDWPSLVRAVVVDDGPDGFVPEDQAALLAGMAESARGRLGPSSEGSALDALAGGETELMEAIGEVVEAMATIADDDSAAIGRRIEAIGLLGFASSDRAGGALVALVAPGEPTAVQAAAVRALGHRRDDEIASELLAPDRFGSYTPSVRAEVLAMLLARSAMVRVVLETVEDGRVPIGAIDAVHRRRLGDDPDPEVRRRAEALFGAVTGDRARVYEDYRDVLALTPVPSNGREVFRRECASCHRLDREGVAVGPDLFDVRNQPKAALLLHLLVPDHEIAPGYVSYNLAVRDGRVLTGLIASESPASITLRQPLGKEDTIPRDEVEELSASGRSLMPQGLENTINRQEFADLLAYLKGEATGTAEVDPPSD